MNEPQQPEVSILQRIETLELYIAQLNERLRVIESFVVAHRHDVVSGKPFVFPEDQR